ncbi:hypothetical protein GCM10012279_39890 [Micromonospora yangpuensis]|nr:hypothetical protein GCM10012279_39890 [Micromonospora yangpuensis]
MALLVQGQVAAEHLLAYVGPPPVVHDVLVEPVHGPLPYRRVDGVQRRRHRRPLLRDCMVVAVPEDGEGAAGRECPPGVPVAGGRVQPVPGHGAGQQVEPTGRWGPPFEGVLDACRATDRPSWMIIVNDIDASSEDP